VKLSSTRHLVHSMRNAAILSYQERTTRTTATIEPTMINDPQKANLKDGLRKEDS
jgi:hypothetical protein